MFLFCPTCGSHLNLTDPDQVADGNYRVHFTCPTCPYKYKVKRRTIESKKYPKLKEVDEVLSDENAWKNAQVTEEQCPKCPNRSANFMELQTRSADEPMTIFYRCCKCTFRWKQ